MFIAKRQSSNENSRGVKCCQFERSEKAVQKRLKLAFEDMEEVRWSPAGAIIRIEGRLESIQARLDRDMGTRADFHEN